MTDRELLEAAAKAAEIVVRWSDAAEEWCRVREFSHKPPRRQCDWEIWDPLTDDGDALRLAVRLNIPVFPYDDETSTGTVGVCAKNWGSKEANTRRAIVRAAAEMATV